MALDQNNQDILEIKVSNSKTATYFKTDASGEVLRLRISRKTALLLAQLIDEEFDMEPGTSRFKGKAKR